MALFIPAINCQYQPVSRESASDCELTSCEIIVRNNGYRFDNRRRDQSSRQPASPNNAHDMNVQSTSDRLQTMSLYNTVYM
jgi:hypothetical protein